MFNKYARYWLVSILLLTTMPGCDSGSHQQSAHSPEPERTSEVKAPIEEQTPTPDSPTIVAPSLPAPPAPENQPLKAKTESKTETKVAPHAETSAAVPEPKQQTALTQKAGSAGLTLRETELKAAPQLDGETLGKLPVSTQLLIFERLGGWYRVSATNDQGWVRMLHVTLMDDAVKPSIGSELASVATIATGREGMGNVAATTGIRGLNEEDLATASPNWARLQDLDNFTVSKVEAEKFALRSGLTSRTIPYLKEPVK
jgi:hypothetical protein